MTITNIETVDEFGNKRIKTYVDGILLEEIRETMVQFMVGDITISML